MKINTPGLGFLLILLLARSDGESVFWDSEISILNSQPQTAVDIGEAKNSPPPVEALIAALRKLPTDQYFDMHGNEDRQIRDLLKRRFATTDAVCKEIDRATGAESPKYVGMLYYCLGYVKDPASIPWLEAKLQTGDSSFLYQDWLRCWRTYPRGADHCRLKWLTQPERWATFFRRQAGREHDAEHRLAVLKALAGWCHDQETIRFFVELEKDPKTDGELLLVTEIYLHQHKQPYDARRLSAAIEKVRSQPQGNETLIEYSKELRHEAFLPFLISLVPTVPEPHLEHVFTEADDIQYALEKITLRQDIVGRAAWQAWYEKHRSESHDVWLQQTANEFETIAEKDPKKAREIFDKALHRWDDRAMLPYIQRWVKYPFLHSQIIGWINLSYHPYWRADVQPLVEKILEASQGRLERWAERIPRDLDFIKNDETWEKQFDWYVM